MSKLFRAVRSVPFAAALAAGVAAQPCPPPPMDAAKWRSDLAYFAEQLPKVHMNAFHDMTREQFAAAVADLDRRIPGLSRDEVLVDLMKLVAMVADGHTHLDLDSARVRAYPLRLYSFTDGIYVISAAKAYEATVGGRVVRLGATPIERAYQAVRTLVPRERDNEMWCRNLGPRLLAVPEVLHGMGLVDDAENAAIAVVKDGREVAAVLHPVPGISTRSWHAWPPLPDGWVDARDLSTTPLWLKDNQKFYWFEYLKDARVLYVQYSAVAQTPDEPVAAFFERVSRFMDANPVEKLVIDVRLNGGGNNYLTRPLLRWILRVDKLNEPGRMFTIIGRQTFSAAENFVDMMEKYTPTIFVGEPTGEAPNMFGDPALIRLPESGIEIWASTLWWQDQDQRDTRKWVPPRLAAELSFEEYRRNVDPAMEAILRYTPSASIAGKVREAVERGDLEAARAAIRAFKANPQNAYARAEHDLNSLGYDLIAFRKLDLAIEVFKLNVEAYPESANVYDSLGEAYASRGDRELAIANYLRSLQLNPKNLGAAAALEKLRAHE
jgi:tetratricopeptide (TPR) repeat protein